MSEKNTIYVANRERIYCCHCRNYSEAGVNRICLRFKDPIPKWHSEAFADCYEPVKEYHRKEIIDLGEE